MEISVDPDGVCAECWERDKKICRLVSGNVVNKLCMSCLKKLNLLVDNFVRTEDKDE